MKIFVINLDSDTERMEAADSQLGDLGVQYQRVSAVDARKQSGEWVSSNVNGFRWWCAVGRPVRAGEVGCAMSHYGVYRQMKNSPICILEDDVVLSERFNEVISYVEKCIDCSRPQVVLLSNHTSVRGDEGDEVCMRKAKSDMYTEGYVITPLAAEALLKANIPMQCPCDWWERWARRGIIELYHAFPTVCSQDQAQYASGTVGVGCFKVSELNRFRWLMHKGKRLIGKIIDGMLPL